MRLFFAALLFFALVVGCSLPPETPVTRSDLMRTRVYNKFVIEESPEQILNVLNREGEVVIDATRRIGSKTYPVKVKLLATTGGVEISEYDQ